jgi:hypothetical protein
MPGRRAKHCVRQTCLRIGDGVTVEIGPTGIVVGDDVDHEIKGRWSRKLGIAERACELTRQHGVVVHDDRTVRPARGRGLDEHGCRTLRRLSRQSPNSLSVIETMLPSLRRQPVATLSAAYDREQRERFASGPPGEVTPEHP